MTALYRKNEILFTAAMILVYMLGSSIAGLVSSYAKTAFYILFAAAVTAWIFARNIHKRHGLCRVYGDASSFAYFIPLIILSTSGIWFGINEANMYLATSRVLGMIAVAYTEEMLFRGFLFPTLKKKVGRSAEYLSAVIFGLFHLLNLFNGSGVGIVEIACQIIYATAFGFMYIIIFKHGKSIIPCIISHSVINVLSVFTGKNAVITALLGAIAIGYALYIERRSRQKSSKD